MSNLTTVPLRAYDLARYASPVPCAVCDTENRFDTAFCSECHAPLSLHASGDKKVSPPQLVTVLGATGVGKTCYLGMLSDMLSRHTSDIQMFARGAFSVALQQQTMAALAQRHFPPPTPVDPAGWQWVQCAIQSRHHKRPLELVVPDLSGAAELGEVETPKSLPAVRKLLTHGAATLVLVDADGLSNGDQTSEFAAMKVVGDLMSHTVPKKMKPWSDRPVALVFTKADRCDWALEAPEEFARRHAPAFWRQCRDQLRRYRFFACSVACVAHAVDVYHESHCIPLRVEPRGVIEPFAWVIENLGRR